MAVHNDAGAHFENEVARIYRAAGYRVQERVQLGGKEFDLIASVDGFGGMTVRIAVECKLRTRGAVSNSEVNDFIQAFDASRRAHNLTFGIMVSTSGFSRTAHTAARDHEDIRLFTFDALDDELLGARTFLQNSHTSYRTDASNYITLSATRHGENGEYVGDIQKECVHRITNGASSFSLLLGDFGTGKTTIAERIHRELREKYISGESIPFPIILYLRTLDQTDSDNVFIEQHLKAVSGQFGLHQLETVRKRSGLTFILDGYDEVATNARDEDRLRLSSRVMRLIGRADHVILTSRPTYFNSIGELNNLVEQLVERDFVVPEDLSRPARRKDNVAQAKLRRQFALVSSAISGSTYPKFPRSSSETFHINPLRKGDIVRYFAPHAAMIKRKYKRSPEQLYDVLSGIYDVTDLLTRPLLLEMFLTLLREGDLDLDEEESELGPASLYALYVNLHLAREWHLRRFLSPEERRAFARTLAVAILQAGGSLEATYEELEAIVKSGGEAFEPARRSLIDTDLREVVTDVRVCAFINVTPQGRFEFSHKSFMEYFVAEVIVNGLSSGTKIPILGANLNYEILYFVGSFCVTWSEYIISLMAHVKRHGASVTPLYISDLKIALLFSERSSFEREYRAIDYGGIRLAKRQFVSCEFVDVNLRNGHYFSLDFSDCNFVRFYLEGEGEGFSFERCRGDLTLPRTIKNLEVRASRELSITAGESNKQSIQQSRITGSDLLMSDGSFEFSNTIIDRTVLSVASDVSVAFTEVVINNSVLRSEDFSASFRFEHTTLDSVTFDQVSFTVEMYLNRLKKFQQCNGLILVDDKSNRLSTFSSKDASGITRYRGYSVEGEIVFFDRGTFVSLVDKVRARVRRLCIDGHATPSELEQVLSRAKG